MIHFHAYLNVNGEYIDVVTSKAETIQKIDLKIWAALAENGPANKGMVYDYSIIEIIIADSRDELNEKIAEGV
jgi:hypothetical protein